ncbi:MAG TPA: hypothetical protein VGD83_03655, partial [Streptosporangiaceae bacterium]
GGVVQQRGLADSSLAADHHDAAAPSADGMEELVENLAFASPVEKCQGSAGEGIKFCQDQPIRRQ